MLTLTIIYNLTLNYGERLGASLGINRVFTPFNNQLTKILVFAIYLKPKDANTIIIS